MRRALATALAVLAVCAAPAWSQDQQQGGRLIPVAATGDTKPKPVKAAAAGSVSIKDFSFAPKSITVNVGDTVSWTNTGKQPHTATGSGFDTGTLKQGQSASHTFSSAGTFNYICTIHPFMKGTVVVAAAASSPSSGGGSSSGSGGSSGSSGSSSGAGAATPSTPGAATPAKPGIPNTGLDVVWLALSGALLLGSGLMLRRRTA
jgi:LPXTG-motif cell wall-anchored protein